MVIHGWHERYHKVISIGKRKIVEELAPSAAN
jgi:hypothetical protein